MCSVLAGLSAVAGALQYKANVDQADAQAEAYERQAAADRRNAELEQRKQEQVADNAVVRDRQLRQKQRLQAGQVRAAAGAAGISSDSGSPLDILSAGWDAYEQDKIMSLTEQRNQNFDLRVNESNYLNRANSYINAANNTRDAARATLIPTILGTATAIASTGAFDGGAGRSAAAGFNSVSSNIGNNTIATFTNGKGFSFGQQNLYGKSLMPKSFFPYK